METQLLKEVLACLRGERTLYYYWPDAYASQLLERIVRTREAISIRELKQSRWSALLNKPSVRELISTSGDGYLRISQLRDRWIESKEAFVLTVDTWGDPDDYEWSQTSRPGYNLVLQMNLSNQWGQRFRRLVRRSANDHFDRGHPLSETRDTTLAWARLDLDFSTDEVLIEEIQTDLVRDVLRLRARAECAIKENREFFLHKGIKINTYAFSLVAGDFLNCFKKIWQDAMLSATIGFVFEELGIGNLYYHSFDTGITLKHLEYGKPPKSLYTDLPEKFCFAETASAPEFLQRNRYARRKLKKMKNGRWYHMAI